MISRRARFAIALSIAPLFASAADVWVASATEKIRPDAQPRQTTEARIAAARNEFEAFQVVVTGPAHGVSARATSLEGPGVVDDVKLYRVDMIDLHTPSALDGGDRPLARRARSGRRRRRRRAAQRVPVRRRRRREPRDLGRGPRAAPTRSPARYFGEVTVKHRRGRGADPGGAHGVGLRAALDRVAQDALRPVVRAHPGAATASPATATPTLRARYGAARPRPPHLALRRRRRRLPRRLRSLRPLLRARSSTARRPPASRARSSRR